MTTDLDTFAARITTTDADEGAIVMFADERSGDDQLEDELTRIARQRGFLLVENEDGDLEIQTDW